MYQRLRYFQHLSHSLEAIISKIEYKEQNIIEWKKKTTELVYKCLKKNDSSKTKTAYISAISSFPLPLSL